MVDIGIASASAGTDAVARLRNGRGRNSDDSSAFQDVMGSSANGQDPASADADDIADGSQTAPDQAAADAELSDIQDAKSALALAANSNGQLDATTAAGKQPKTIPQSNATVADAMATLGLTSGSKTDTPVTTATPSTPAAPNAQGAQKATAPQFASTLTSLQQQPATDATVATDPADAATSQPSASGSQDAASTALPLADMMQQLGTVIQNDTTAAAKPAATKPTAQSDSDTGKDAATDDDAAAAGADVPSGAVNDALSLLNAMTPAAAQAQAASAAAAGAAGQALPTSGKAQVQAGGTSALQVATAAAAGDASSTAATDKLAIPSSSAADVAGLLPRGIGNGTATTSSTSDDSAADTFRIARANGKAQAVDMAISKSADDAAQLDAKSAGATGTDTVTVLDQRRYLGLADGSNSALVTNALTGDKALASALKTSATAVIVAPSATSKVVNTLKIQMNPEKLGTVTATMRLQGEALSVDLKVQSAEAYRQLSNDQSSMVDSLRAQGYQVDNITVTYAPQQSADAGSQQNNSQAGFQGQQQSGASQGQGGEAQSRRQNSGQQANDQDRVWGTQNGSADDGLAGGSQRTRSAGVYL